MHRKLAIASAIAAAIVAFGAGAGVMRRADTHHATGSSGAIAEGRTRPGLALLRPPEIGGRAARRRSQARRLRLLALADRHLQAGSGRLRRADPAARSVEGLRRLRCSSRADLGHPPAVPASIRTIPRSCASARHGLPGRSSRHPARKGLPSRGGDTLASNADVDFVLHRKAALCPASPRRPGVITTAARGDPTAVRRDRDPERQQTGDRGLARAGPQPGACKSSQRARSRPARATTPVQGFGDDSPDDEGTMVWKARATWR